jgi:hypothetical protein
MSANPYNTPYGAYLKSTEELDKQLANAQQDSNQKIQQGQGYLSQDVQNCYLYPPEGQEGPPQPVPAGTAGAVCDPAQTVTPGSTVKSDSEQVLATKVQTLLQADEVNEIINYAAAYILNDILTGTDDNGQPVGLAGYTGSADRGSIDPGEVGSGAGEDEPAGPPGAPKCFAQNGAFLVGSLDNPTISYQMNLPANVSYDKITVDVDVNNGGWYSAPGDPTNGVSDEIFYLRRQEWADLFGYSYVRGPNVNVATISHGVALPTEGKLTQVAHGYVFPVGATHHYSYTYDTAQQKNTPHHHAGEQCRQTIRRNRPECRKHQYRK